MSFKKHIIISEEVAEAVSGNKAVVALESTIISHGMPYPQNYDTALEVENIVRCSNAVPATIAILGGIIKVGLSNEDIEILSTDKNILKASRRDLPVIISKKLNAIYQSL